MATHELRIVNRLVQLPGKIKPVCEVKAIIPPAEAKILVDNFGNEPLFKRTSFATGFADCGYELSPSLQRTLANFVRNDACPEVLVKTMIGGQRFEGSTLWDILCFEFCVRLGFDALLELCRTVREFDQVHVYRGRDAEAAEVAGFIADAAHDQLALAS